MCLAVPVRVVEIGANDAAIVDLGGVRKQISLALVDDVAVGDYVILHVGYALAKLDAAEAARTLALFRQAGLSLPDGAVDGEGDRLQSAPRAQTSPSPVPDQSADEVEKTGAAAGRGA